MEIPKKFRLNLKSYQQTTEYSCGAACTKTILESYGIVVPEAYIMRRAHTSNKHGTYPKDIVKEFKEFDLNAEIREDSDFEHVQRAMLEGHKAMAMWSDWGGHFVCFDGWELSEEDDWKKDLVILADPYDRLSMSQDGFNKVNLYRFISMWVDWQYEKEIVRKLWIDVWKP